MASASALPSFPSRSFTSALNRPGSTIPQNTYNNNPAQNPYYQTAPTNNPVNTFGTTSQQQQQQRDRERLERERRDAEERNALESLSEEHREEINEAFALFDLDKDSYIDYHELKVSLKALGFDLPKPDILALLQQHGIPADIVRASAGSNQNQQQMSAIVSNHNAKPTFAGPSRLLVSQAAFVTLAARMIAARDPREEIMRAFALFDPEGKGKISLEDLRRVALELGEGLQEEELVAMIEEFDMDGDGMINKEDFVAICLG